MTIARFASKKGIINDATNIFRIKHSSTKHINNKKSLTTQLFLFKQITKKEFSQHICFSLTNDNGTFHFQQGIFNDNTG